MTKDLIVIGAGKFAVEVTRYIDDITRSGSDDYQIRQYLAVDGEAVHAPRERCVALDQFRPAPGVGVVLAISDMRRRRALIEDVITEHGLSADNIVHPTSRVDARQMEGGGNIIGPNCYVGANVRLGSYNVVNYHCTIGHHSQIGSNNFIAPNFNCGNSVEVGDGNFFGLSCTLAPEIVIGSDNTFQAGISFFDNAKSGYSYLSPNRVKPMKSL